MAQKLESTGLEIVEEFARIRVIGAIRRSPGPLAIGASPLFQSLRQKAARVGGDRLAGLARGGGQSPQRVSWQCQIEPAHDTTSSTDHPEIKLGSKLGPGMWN
jgi:hypothetical protein